MLDCEFGTSLWLRPRLPQARRWPVARRARGATSDAGTSSLELVLYMPLLFVAIFTTVQISLFYLGNQAAAAAVREAARVARTGGATSQALADAQSRGDRYAVTVGKGVIVCSPISVQVIGGQQVRASVSCTGLRLVPGLPLPAITQIAQGPIEGFRSDK